LSPSFYHGKKKLSKRISFFMFEGINLINQLSERGVKLAFVRQDPELRDLWQTQRP
jgi:hypothetical protein